MVKIKFAALAAVILAAIAVQASAQQATQAGVSGALPDGKVAVVNTSAFPAQINELKQKYDQVDNQFKDRSQKIQTGQQQLSQMENDIRTKGPAMTQDNLARMQTEYEDLKKRITREIEDARADYDKAIENATRPIRDKLFQFLQTYATQRSIVLVINLAGAAQTGTIAFVSPGADITTDFISEYNKANPVPGAAPPSTQPATPKPATPKPAGTKQ